MVLPVTKKLPQETAEKATKVPRDLRYRRQHFPDGDKRVFNVGEKGFVPVPIILRKLLRYLTAPEVRVLLYLYLRASRHGLCYPSTEEIVHELGLTTKKNLMPHLKTLQAKRFISIETSGSKTFYLIHDPRIAIRQMLASGEVKGSDLFEINDLYADLNQAPVEAPHDKSEPA